MIVDALRVAYGDLAAVALALDEQQSWRPTGCAGWCVRDVIQHLLSDAQGALVALATPANGPADTTAVIISSQRAELSDLIATQGHVLTVGDLLATLVVEATVHHLDLGLDLDVADPASAPLEVTLSTLAGLLGRATPDTWNSADWVRTATGRAEPTAEQRHYLGADLDRLPLLR